MRKFIITWFVNTLALFIVAYSVPGIGVDRWNTAIVAALVLGLLNAFLKPFILLVTLPITVLSLGLFTLVINGFLFYLAAKLVKGFTIAGFWTAFWGALLFSIVSFLLNLWLNPSRNVAVRFHRSSEPPRPQEYRDAIDVDAVPTDKADNPPRFLP